MRSFEAGDQVFVKLGGFPPSVAGFAFGKSKIKTPFYLFLLKMP